MCRSQWERVLPRSPIPPACSLTLRHAKRPVPPHHSCSARTREEVSLTAWAAVLEHRCTVPR
eukprot:831046-Prymnesium_polylepis.1